MTKIGTKSDARQQFKQELRIVGMRFHSTREFRQSLRTWSGRKGGLELDLQREPDNRFDGNAIAVYLPSPKDTPVHIGYVGKESAEVLAPYLDEGKVRVASARIISVDSSLEYGTMRLVLEQTV